MAASSPCRRSQRSEAGLRFGDRQLCLCSSSVSFAVFRRFLRILPICRFPTRNPARITVMIVRNRSPSPRNSAIPKIARNIITCKSPKKSTRPVPPTRYPRILRVRPVWISSLRRSRMERYWRYPVMLRARRKPMRSPQIGILLPILLVHLLLQLRQQVQRLQRRQPVQIHVPQLLQHRLRERRKNRQLRRRRTRSR